MCTNNNSVYIGETSKTAHKHIMEHWLTTCDKNISLPSIAENFNLYNNNHSLFNDKSQLNLKIINDYIQ